MGRQNFKPFSFVVCIARNHSWISCVASEAGTRARSIDARVRHQPLGIACCRNKITQRQKVDLEQLGDGVIELPSGAFGIRSSDVQVF